MTYAAITGWGKCMPPSVLTNADLATFLDTTDDWITTRTGIRERRISHVSGIDMAAVASARALATAAISMPETCDTRRSRMPVRVVIHSSVVSRNDARSAFESTDGGMHLPHPVMAA